MIPSGMKRFFLTIIVAIVCHVCNAWCAEVCDVKRHYISLPEDVCDTLAGVAVDTSAVRWTFEARASFDGLGKRTVWGFGWISDDGRSYEVEVMRVVNDNVMGDDIVDDPSLRIVVSMGDSCLCSKVVSKGMATASGYNTLTVEITCSHIIIYAGSGLLEPIATLSGQFAPVKICQFICRGSVTVDYAVVEEGFPAWHKVATSWTLESLERYLTQCNAPEGMWRYLDRDMDPSIARLGGKYQVILISNSDGGYDIIYYSGAETYADEWRCGMLKGTLTQSPFAGQYDLKWYDAQFGYHSDEAYATFSENNRLLTISLPLLRATLRFARLDE